MSAPVNPGGPRVVALGGGYGLSTTLRAARLFASDIVGIVSVADDGGSSGRLRTAFGIPAPGDLRRCLVALADEDSVWAEAFEHRFAASELDGHPLGNIVIAGLTATLGNFSAAIDEALRLLGGVGRVYPATVEPVTLTATYRREVENSSISVYGTVEGEVRVGSTVGVESVSVSPLDPDVPPAALSAVAEADMLCIGPGSLFTSVLAVVAVPQIRAALATAKGRKVYIANLGQQHPETTGYDVAMHVEALRSHGVHVDVVLHDPSALELGAITGVELVASPLANTRGRLHDPSLLAEGLRSVVG